MQPKAEWLKKPFFILQIVAITYDTTGSKYTHSLFVAINNGVTHSFIIMKLKLFIYLSCILDVWSQ
jgi:hypothetical protein